MTAGGVVYTDELKKMAAQRRVIQTKSRNETARGQRNVIHFRFKPLIV